MPRLFLYQGGCGSASVPTFCVMAVWLALLALAPAQAAVQANAILHDSIREVAEMPATGPINLHKPFITRKTLTPDESSGSLEFEVTLKMRNFSELQARVAQGDRISADEMAAKYDPAPADYQTVLDWMVGQGFKISRQDSNHLAIFARGKVSEIGHAMQLNFAKVTLEGNEYTSAISAPVVPAMLAPLIVGINGLQPHIRAHKGLLKPNSLTGTNPPYLPSQIAQAYHANGLYQTNITGAGQTIAIVIDTFPAASDLQGFWQTYGVNQSINNISFIQTVAGTLPTPSGEETLDVEWSSAMAPGAKVRVYASLDLSEANLDQAYQQIYSDVRNHPEYEIHQISLSYGEGETYTTSSQVQTDAQYFANLAAAGVTLFASSGDGTAFPNESGGTQGGTRMEQADTPASDPNVIGVGGTTLELDSSGNVSNEPAWNFSGGGPSLYFSRPSWQVGPGVPGGSARLVPDVAAAADPNYAAVYYFQGGQSSIGGTSWSSPVWAGFCALINQARSKASLPSIGALGPRIYPLLGTANFRDITSGNNGYAAGTGYDLVTGIGVPNMQTLAQTLAGPPVVSTWTPPPTPILHSFSDGSTLYDAQYPSSMIQGTDGNFYGATAYGGSNFYFPGAVFKMTPAGAVSILHSFADGSVPNDGYSANSGLVQDSSGNLYGTTYTTAGGEPTSEIFKTTLQGITTILYSFPAFEATPMGLVAGTDGNFYGITIAGQFYKITPQGAFTTITTLSNFTTEDGVSLIRGNDGNFYGTTGFGGYANCGTAFELTPQGTYTLLHEFGDGSVPADGTEPQSPLCQASDGNFYGTTRMNDTETLSGGTLFRMTPQGVVTILHQFADGSLANDGMTPGPVIQASDGSLYGTTSEGGTDDQGITFRQTLGPSNVYTILHNFGDGSVPNDGNSGQSLIQGTNGNIYGLASNGGANNFGTAFLVESFTSQPSATFVVGLAQTFDVTTAGVPESVVSATGLPSWASLNSSTGVLSGTPPNTTGAPFTITFTVSNGGTTPALTQTFTLNVVPSLATSFTSTPPTSSATVGTAYSFGLEAAGYPLPTFSLTSGSLPPGLTLTGAGLISGTPTQGGIYTGAITASNGAGPNATQIFNITVGQSPGLLSALPTTLLVGVPYVLNLQTTGYPAPTFTVVDSGTLPHGLTLSASGELSGTPDRVGSYGGEIAIDNGFIPGLGEYYDITVQQGVVASLSQWESTNSISDPAAIPLKDGVPNLLKYLYHIDPTQSMSASDHASLPVVGIDTTSNPGTPYLTLTYRQYAYASGVTVHVQTSSDLQTWQTVDPPDLNQQVGNDAVTGDPIMEVGVMATGTDRLFIRLNVTSP